MKVVRFVRDRFCRLYIHVYRILNENAYFVHIIEIRFRKITFKNCYKCELLIIHQGFGKIILAQMTVTEDNFTTLYSVSSNL